MLFPVIEARDHRITSRACDSNVEFLFLRRKFIPLGEPVVPRSDSRMCKVGSEIQWLFPRGCQESKSREPTGVDPHQYKANQLSYTSSCLT
jgi:hypothetical protein